MTILRSSVPSVVATGVPQLGQNRAPSGSGSLHTSHRTAPSIGAGSDPERGGTPLADSEVMPPTTFAAPEDFRDWLRQHHDSATELWVGYYKKATGTSMTEQSVDEASATGGSTGSASGSTTSAT